MTRASGRLLAASALLLLPPGPAPAQDASAPEGGAPSVFVEARLDKRRAALGEPITMTVTARHAVPLAWEPRSVGGSLGSFDVEQVEGPSAAPPGAAPGAPPADPNGPAAGLLTRWVFRLAGFELGRKEIPPIQLRYSPAGSPEARSAPTPALEVEIVPTVTDPNAEAADIRTGFALPRDLTPWLVGAAAATLAAASIIFLARRLRRRRRRPAAAPAAPKVPPRPAYDRYREALERLLRSGLLEAGRLKQFHVELAEIVKRYLGEVYGFDAVDRTTWEVMQDLSAVAAAAPVRSEARAFLDACDLVKFAKHAPGGDEIDLTVARARRILDLARPRPAAAPGPEAAAAAAAAGRAGAR